MRMFHQLSQVPQTTSRCPAICAMYCAPECPVRCCNMSLSALSVPSRPSTPAFCPQTCYKKCTTLCPAGCCSSMPQEVTPVNYIYTGKLPCPTDCYSSCHGNCPPGCCNMAIKRNRMLTYSSVSTSGEDNIQAIHGGNGVRFLTS